MTTDVNPHAYNTAWQFRADGWCRLEEAGRRLSTAAVRGNDLSELVDLVEGLLSQLRPFERYWAFPGTRSTGIGQISAIACIPRRLWRWSRPTHARGAAWVTAINPPRQRATEALRPKRSRNQGSL